MNICDLGLRKATPIWQSETDLATCITEKSITLETIQLRLGEPKNLGKWSISYFGEKERTKPFSTFAKIEISYSRKRSRQKIEAKKRQLQTALLMRADLHLCAWYDPT